MGFDNPLLFPKSKAHLSFFSIFFFENVLIHLLLVGLTFAPGETDFLLANAHDANPTLLLGDFPAQLWFFLPLWLL